MQKNILFKTDGISSEVSSRSILQGYSRIFKYLRLSEACSREKEILSVIF